MASNAIGMIETKGYVAALAAADAMVKAANVTITDRQQVGDRHGFSSLPTPCLLPWHISEI